jgi:WD40 repeat protein
MAAWFGPIGRLAHWVSAASVVAIGCTVAACNFPGQPASAKLVGTYPEQFVDKVAFSPDGRFVTDSEREWKLINSTLIGAGSLWATFEDASGPVAYSADGQVVATGSTSSPGSALLWNASTGAPLRTLSAHIAQVRALAFSPDGRTLATGSLDRTVRLWDVASGQSIAVLTGQSDGVASLAFSPDGKSLRAGGERGAGLVWHVDAPVLRDASQAAADFGTIDGTVWKGAEPGIADADDYTADGQLFGYGSFDRFSIWSVASGARLSTVGASSARDFARLITAARFSPDGRTVAISFGKDTELWDVRTTRRLAVLHTGATSGLAFSPDGLELAVAQDSGQLSPANLELWDIRGPMASLKR